MNTTFGNPLRLVIDTVVHCMTNEERPGILVQEFDPDEPQRGWQTVCPLTDANFMVPACPPKWFHASEQLRDLMEAGHDVTLADERAALGIAF